MTDIPTPEYGKPAKRAPTPSKTWDYEPIPGWKIPVPISPDGMTSGVACAPTGQTVKIKPADGTVGRMRMPGPRPRLAAAPYRPKE